MRPSGSQGRVSGRPHPCGLRECVGRGRFGGVLPPKLGQRTVKGARREHGSRCACSRNTPVLARVRALRPSRWIALASAAGRRRSVPGQRIHIGRRTRPAAHAALRPGGSHMNRRFTVARVQSASRQDGGAFEGVGFALHERQDAASLRNATQPPCPRGRARLRPSLSIAGWTPAMRASIAKHAHPCSCSRPASFTVR